MTIPIFDMSAERRWQKISDRLTQQGIAGLARWLTYWLYWNAHLYRALPPAALEQLRLGYKYHRPFKKYGIADPIIVYQMGKVASTSVYNSLLALDLDVPVYHLHFLNDLDAQEDELRKLYPPQHGGRVMIRTGREIRQRMRSEPRRKWNLISLVRLPIPRAISGFFMKLEHYFPSYPERIEGGELTVQEIAAYFAAHYRDRMHELWFERQLKDPFGLDVYASEFPKARGYQIYEQGNLRLLLMRSEDLNRAAAGVMREFLGVPNFRLVNQNLAQEKKYAAVYQEFQRVLRLPPAFVHQVNNSQFAQHFYTPEELAASVQRWL